MIRSILAWLVLSAMAAVSAPISYYAELSGAAEDVPNASPATGLATVTIDVIAETLYVQAVFSNLTAPNTAAHIHCCTAAPLTGTAGVATTTPTFPGFPSGTTSGTYLNVLDLSSTGSFNASFITANGGTTDGAMNALAAGLASGRAYFNIHTSTFPAGEIRGFLNPVPEPGTLGLAGAALAVLALIRRRHS